MPKRAPADGDTPEPSPPRKRSRPASSDHLSTLSNELILRIFSFLPRSQLVICQQLSHKYQSLSCDSHLWRCLYYDRFVRPRASRLPGLKTPTASHEIIRFAAKPSQWLDEEHLLRLGKTNWKRQYKLRHNWAMGSCAVSDIPVAENTPVPPVLVQMHEGIIVMVDMIDGIRAWSAGERRLIAQFTFPSSRISPPTAFAIDPSVHLRDEMHLMIGFEDGSFDVYVLRRSPETLTQVYRHGPADGVITAGAIAFPYVLTMTATQQLTLYKFEERSSGDRGMVPAHLDAPKMIHSLKAHAVMPPLSTSLRISPATVTICIAYVLPTYLSGWTVGLQEVKVSSEGDYINSRIASAVDQHYRPLAFSSFPMVPHLAGVAPSAPGSSAAMELRHIHSKPTSLSYTHPYLLVAQPDNTLTLYLVTSNADSLSISPGSRLWGHTSAVSGAHVGGRGKAVSVSRRGDELRVWELEGGFASTAAKKRLAGGAVSVQIKPETPSSLSTTGLSLINEAMAARPHSASGASEDGAGDASELTLSRGWIGFDDENVVVLKERPHGAQALVVYDFT